MMSILALAKLAATASMITASAHSYVVAPGDTMSEIASAHGMSLGALEADNPGVTNLIYPGQVIEIPGAGGWEPAQGGLSGYEPHHEQAPAYGSSSYGSGPSDTASVTGGGIPGAIGACIRQHESGGDATAVNPTSGAGGIWQVIPSTWASLGYASQYPGGAQTAPVSVQNAAAAQLYAQSGTSPWAGDGCVG